ncbi:MAG: hypothetical protein QXJ75_05630 [Candidatus Bathyarchaeia archaeon]
MGYTDIATVRALTGVTSTSVSDLDIAVFIEAADAKIEKLLGVFSAPHPVLIKRLSTLLAAIDTVRRIPEWKQRQEELQAWEREVWEIFELYGGAARFEKT